MIRIGLVDDDFSIRRALGRLLRSHGYECIAYPSAEEALRDPEFLEMDCLILDIELLGMNGFQLRDRVRELGAPIPYLFITAHTESDYPDWDAQIGNGSFLLKPVEANQLLCSVDKLLPDSGCR